MYAARRFSWTGQCRRGPMEASSFVPPGARHRGVVWRGCWRGAQCPAPSVWWERQATCAESSAVRDNNTTLDMLCSEPLCSRLCKSHALCTCTSCIHPQVPVSVSRISSPTCRIPREVPLLRIPRRRLLCLVPVDDLLRLGNRLECDLSHLSTSPDTGDRASPTGPSLTSATSIMAWNLPSLTLSAA